MCGRAACSFNAEELTKTSRYKWKDEREKVKWNRTTYNLKPTNLAPIIITENNMANFTIGKWGFNSKTKKLLINARSDSFISKKFPYAKLGGKRGILVVNGFYEWKEKQPYFITNPQRVMYLGCVWRDDAEHGVCFIIMTTDACDKVSNVHNRMPVIIQDDQLGIWLDPRTSLEKIAEMTIPNSNVEMYPVSADVSLQKDGPELIQPIKLARIKTIDSFFKNESKMDANFDDSALPHKSFLSTLKSPLKVGKKFREKEV